MFIFLKKIIFQLFDRWLSKESQTFYNRNKITGSFALPQFLLLGIIVIPDT
jgi:hypothetical protein